MRRALTETAISAAAIGVLVLALASADSRVREQIALRFSARPSETAAIAGRQLQDLAAIVVQAVRDQSIAHAPLVILVVAGVVLLVFRLRT